LLCVLGKVHIVTTITDIQRKGARDQNSTLKNQVKESNSTHAAKAKDLDAIKKKLQFQTIKEFDAAISYALVLFFFLFSTN